MYTLADMYVLALQAPQACAYISGKSPMPVLQLHITCLYVTGFDKTRLTHTRTEIQFIAWGYRWPGLLSQAVFCQPCKTTTVHYRVYDSMGPLMGTNKAAWGVKLLLMTVLAYQADCGSFCALLNTQHCCLSPCGWYCPPLASHQPPMPTHPL